MKVKAIINFKDLKENVNRKVGDVFVVTKERADFLIKHNAIEVIEEEIIENVEYSKDVETIPEEEMNEEQKKSFEEKKKEKSKSKRSRK